MPKPASPVILGLEEFETYRGGPRAGQTWNDELPCLLVHKPLVGLMCRWELSEQDRISVADGADIFLTLFTGGSCPPMRVELFTKNVDASHIADTRGVIKNIPSNELKYSPEQIAEMRKAGATDAPSTERHKTRHLLLHHQFDELMADYLSHNRNATPSTTSLTQLMEWSHKQTIENLRFWKEVIPASDNNKSGK